MKTLWTVVKDNLREDESIFITTKSKLDDINNSEWWKMEEFTFDQIFNNYSGKERVNRFWHEDGLCIVLNM